MLFDDGGELFLGAGVVWLLNPGSCSAMQGSYAVLTIENGGFHAELKEIG